MNFIRRIFVAIFVLASYGTGANAATCNVDQYLVDGTCVSCIYNATCDGQNYKCNDGFYDDGTSQCLECPPNSTCTSPTDFSCVPGTFLHNGVCTACPSNATCAGGTDMFHCNPGSYRNGMFCPSCGENVCDGETLVSCAAGYFYYNWSGISCSKCDATMHCPAGTNIQSVTCVEGYYKSAYHCYKCPDEYYCPDSTATVDNYTQYCAPGYYQNGGVCVACPVGVVCPGHKAHACPDGLFWHDNGQCLSYAQGDPGVAPNCNPGFYDNNGVCETCPVENSTCRSATDFDCNAGFYKNGSQCDVCPAYATCPAASTQISCIDGYWLNGAVCTRCSGTNYCNNNTMYPCPAFDPSSLDELLPAGHKIVGDNFRLNVWAANDLITKASDCSLLGGLTIETPDGFYIKTSMWWNGERYWGSRDYWIRTETPGRYLSGATNFSGKRYYRQNNACTNAPANAIYTGAGSPDGNDCPWRCNDGYFRDVDVCTVCPSDLECKDGKIVCPIGKYASGNSCLNCPEHYTDRASDNTAPQSINECQIRCAGGTYLATANATQCVNVGAGFWNPTNYINYGSVGTRNRCPDNLKTIGYGVGADDAGDCGKVLNIGKYSVWLHTEKRTRPSLSVQYGNHVLYGDMTTSQVGRARTEYNGAVYSIYNSQID